MCKTYTDLVFEYTATTETYTYRHTLSLHGAHPIDAAAHVALVASGTGIIGRIGSGKSELASKLCQIQRAADHIHARIERIAAEGMAPGQISPGRGHDMHAAHRDRKSVVQGKSVSVRVDLGGGRIMKKQIRRHSMKTTGTQQ